MARELAACLRATRRGDGYLEGDGVRVTWAFGHLVGLQEPHEYDPALKRWGLAALPILPNPFRLRVLGDERSRKQFAILARLLEEADELVCATDAGREGELIFRYIVQLAGVTTKPVQRLWLSSLTREAITKGFAALRPGSDFDPLFHAARCRSESDWIVGLNATRCYTVRHGGGGLLWTLGRVQTPVLAMVVARDDEIRTFVAVGFWELVTKYRGALFKRHGDRLEDARAAQELLARVTGAPLAITRVEAKDERVPPPLLHDLTALQRDMNAKHGMPAAETLQVAQKLYEDQLLTYPRTDSRHLPQDLHEDVRRTLLAFTKVRPQDVARITLDPLAKPARVFDDSKVSDHHAIVPTGRQQGGLAPAEQRVFDAVVTRLLMAFYPDQEKQVTTVSALCADVPLRATGVVVKAPGWTQLEPQRRAPQPRSTSAKDEGDDSAQELPHFTVGETGPHEPELRERSTTPPRPFTDASLLAAMETAGRLVDDEELKAALKAKGLGTPATRAAVIETLLQRGYLVRDKKALRATDHGRYLIAVVPHQELKSPALTGEWEGKLEAIARGKLAADEFMQQIGAYARELVARSAGPTIDETRFGPCPRCGKAVIEGQRGYGCADWKSGCRFVLWKEYRGALVDARKAKELLQRGVSLRALEIPGLGPRVLYLTPSGQVVDVAPPRAQATRAAPPATPAPATAPKQKTPCPRCGAQMVETKDSYACRGRAQGCPFTIAKVILGKKISRATARKLAKDGRTAVLAGFCAKDGKEFSARLSIDASGQVVIG